MTERAWLQLMHWGAKCGCHQIAQRSFFYKKMWQFPVCARCTGLPLGWLAAVPVGLLLRPPLWIGLACLCVMGLDWGLQRFFHISSTNLRRLITGAMGGFGYMLLLMRLILIFLA